MTMAGRVNEGRGAGTNGAETDKALIDLATSEADEAWLSRTRIFLQPIAPPSVMGLMGFAVATMMVGAWQAGWYGDASTPLILWPFTLVAGGLLQIIAAVACFRARDSIALGVHSIWGAFWLAWSTLEILVALHVTAPIPLGAPDAGFGFWFIGLTVVTMSGFFASLAQSGLLAIVLGSLSAGSALTAAGFWAGSLTTTEVGGWLFVVSAASAWLFATAMQLEGAFGRTIIPLGKLSADANVPGRRATRPIERPTGMPGVRVGQ